MTDIPGISKRSMLRIHAGNSAKEDMDWVSVEEPLEIRIHSETLAMTMRTPGEDEILTLGFLYSEGLIQAASDVSSIRHCGRPEDEGYGNLVEVTCAAGYRLPWDKLEKMRRGTLTTASCGVCGRKTIDDLLDLCGAVTQDVTLPVSTIADSTKTLAQAQQNFRWSGGLHAAAALDKTGRLLVAHEDVGRHNAVDKVIGALIRADALPNAAILVVSGRTSFEIVQKAVRAQIPCVTSVSAPSSLAIELADKAHVTLAGFVREGQFNLYTHPQRMEGHSSR